jgi:hypothetical protein
MKKIFLIGLILFSTIINARQMYKVKCLTPAGKEDRTKLSRFIHLDMIAEDHVIAVVNQSELKDLQNKLNLEIEILSSFDTDKVQVANENFNVQILMSDQGEQGLDFYQEYHVSAKSKLEINLNDLIREKIPNDFRTYSFTMQNSPSYAKRWNFNAGSNLWMSQGELNLKGKQDQIKFETSPAVNPMIKLTLIINYL